MKNLNALTVCFALFVMTALLLSAGTANAAVRGADMGGFSTIDQAGNAADPDTGSNYGSVGYKYDIAKHGTSIANWDTMKNDIGSGSNIFDSGNYNTWNDGTSGNVGVNAPAADINLYQMAGYANWLTSGDPQSGFYDIKSDYSGWNTTPAAHGSTDMGDLIDTYGKVYALPTEDEYYKAAYYSLDESTVGGGEVYYEFADGTDNPAGEHVVPTAGDSANDEWNYDGTLSRVRAVGQYGLEQNDTRNMMGNIFEKMENEYVRAGHSNTGETTINSSYRNDRSGDANSGLGFRVVAIPEPASGLLLVLAGGLLLFGRRRRSHA